MLSLRYILLVPAFAVFYQSALRHYGAPIVTLDYATFRGIETGNLRKFLGMPFANAPYVFFDQLRNIYPISLGLGTCVSAARPLPLELKAFKKRQNLGQPVLSTR